MQKFTSQGPGKSFQRYSNGAALVTLDVTSADFVVSSQGGKSMGVSCTPLLQFLPGRFPLTPSLLASCALLDVSQRGQQREWRQSLFGSLEKRYVRSV